MAGESLEIAVLLCEYPFGKTEGSFKKCSCLILKQLYSVLNPSEIKQTRTVLKFYFVQGDISKNK